MHYVIGDVHGCLDELLSMISLIEQKDPDATCILLGDIIDRGPKVVETCEWFVNNITSDGKFQSVIGNHEHAKICDFNHIVHQDRDTEIEKCWEEIKYSIDDSYGSVHQFPTYSSYKQYLDFCLALPYWKDITVNGKRFIIVHADLTEDVLDDNGNITPNDQLTWDQQTSIVWDRNYFGFDVIPDATLICGHTPTVSRTLKRQAPGHVTPGKVYHYKNRYNIDCGCVFRYHGHDEGKLAAICLETEEILYV